MVATVRVHGARDQHMAPEHPGETENGDVPVSDISDRYRYPSRRHLGARALDYLRPARRIPANVRLHRRGAGSNLVRLPNRIGGYTRTVSLIFFGRPPSLPLRRAAADLAFVDALPPILPIAAAIQRLEPRKPSSSAGK